MINKSNYSYVQVNFRIIGEHAKILNEAAASHGEKTAAYCRRVMLEWAAADLGIARPDLSEYNGDIIFNAAKKLGMTPQEFTTMVAREQAARVMLGDKGESIEKLSNDLITQLRKHESGEMTKAVGGMRRR